MGKLALLFSGQGSQYIGMGKNICTQYKVAKDTFEEAGEILGFDLLKQCIEGDESWINQTKNIQPAVLALEMAMFRVYMQEFGIVPACCIGHSLGEISALTCSGAIKFEDAIKLVAKRGEFMQNEADSSSGKMLVVMNADLKTIERECEEISNEEHMICISNYNSPKQIVLSGHEDGLNIFYEKLKGTNGIKMRELNVKAPFHCALMHPAAEKFRKELEKYEFNDLNYPVISNVDARPYENKNCIKDNLAKQIVSPVRWIDTIGFLEKIGVDTALEIGPKSILRNLLMRYENEIKSYSYDLDEDRKKFKNWADNLKAEDFKNTVV
ncbi:MAG: ACP S-malonyltransferase [Romboutsia sp.]|nr:ACP S-malonyltransferase [Romboutsia sp.]